MNSNFLISNVLRLADPDVVVVDDSVILGGTKQRYLYELFYNYRRFTKEWVYISTTYSFVQVAVAAAAQAARVKATLFIPPPQACL